VMVRGIGPPRPVRLCLQVGLGGNLPRKPARKVAARPNTLRRGEVAGKTRDGSPVLTAKLAGMAQTRGVSPPLRASLVGGGLTPLVCESQDDPGLQTGDPPRGSPKHRSPQGGLPSERALGNQFSTTSGSIRIFGQRKEAKSAKTIRAPRGASRPAGPFRALSVMTGAAFVVQNIMFSRYPLPAQGTFPGEESFILLVHFRVAVKTRNPHVQKEIVN